MFQSLFNMLSKALPSAAALSDPEDEEDEEENNEEQEQEQEIEPEEQTPPQQEQQPEHAQEDFDDLTQRKRRRNYQATPPKTSHILEGRASFSQSDSTQTSTVRTKGRAEVQSKKRSKLKDYDEWAMEQSKLFQGGLVNLPQDLFDEQNQTVAMSQLQQFIKLHIDNLMDVLNEGSLREGGLRELLEGAGYDFLRAALDEFSQQPEIDPTTLDSRLLDTRLRDVLPPPSASLQRFLADFYYVALMTMVMIVHAVVDWRDAFHMPQGQGLFYTTLREVLEKGAIFVREIWRLGKLNNTVLPQPLVWVKGRAPTLLYSEEVQRAVADIKTKLRRQFASPVK